MKPLIAVIVAAALAAGGAAWADAQNARHSWSQHYWPGTNQMQMVGQTPKAGQTAPEFRTYAACPYSSHQCSHWCGWLIPGHRANCHSDCGAGPYRRLGAYGCR